MTERATTLEGPAWDNSDEYPSLKSAEVERELAAIESLVQELTRVAAVVTPYLDQAETLSGPDAAPVVAAAQEATRIYDKAIALAYNLRTFAGCEASVDGRNAEAKALGANLQTVFARIGEAYNPVKIFLRMTTDANVDAFLQAADVKAHAFGVRHDRKRRDHALSLAEENLILGLSVNGPDAWGRLYDSLSGTIECAVELPTGPKTMGLAGAASLLQDESEDVRRAAFRAIQSGWRQHEESVASVLNALAGWRLDLYRRRSKKKPMHFLDGPLHTNRMQRATLDAMMTAVTEARPVAQRTVKLQAKLLGKDRLAPWDLFAPCPTFGQGAGYKPGYPEAIDTIAKAFATIDPAMGTFVRMMDERRWIEGRVLPHKRPGAYCTGFAKSRHPRVYMTYGGGMRELKTLAHELGHAFHEWVMREMPLAEIHYPMTLAETASILGETIVNEELVHTAATPVDRLRFTWSSARELESFVLNIPARFTFECALYERRAASSLSATELSDMMRDAWTAWYGDSLSETDPLFWASKLHFSIASVSFYNFPYTFGYLFALGVYAQRAKLGAGFYDAYVALLRDTGRMSAEDVAAKHLGADLTQPQFWRESLAIATRSVEAFEKAAAPFL